MLEVGCGQGGFAARLAQAYDYVGVEPDGVSCSVAQQRLAAAGGAPARCATVTWRRWSPRARRSTWSCAFEVIEHIEDDGASDAGVGPGRLRPGGSVLLSTPACRSASALPTRWWATSGGTTRRCCGRCCTVPGLVDVELLHFGAPLGYVLEAGRNAVGPPPAGRTAPSAASHARAPPTRAAGRCSPRRRGRRPRPGWAPCPSGAVQRAFPEHRPRPGGPRHQAGGVTVADVSEHVDDLAAFISAAPSSYHAAAEAARRLADAGFSRLDEAAGWDTDGDGPGRHFVQRDGSVVAWVRPATAGPTTPFRILGAHTDSPGFMLKPRAHDCFLGLVAGCGRNLRWTAAQLLARSRIWNSQVASPPSTGKSHLVRTGPLMRIPHSRSTWTGRCGEGLTLDRQRHRRRYSGSGARAR